MVGFEDRRERCFGDRLWGPARAMFWMWGLMLLGWFVVVFLSDLLDGLLGLG